MGNGVAEKIRDTINNVVSEQVVREVRVIRGLLVCPENIYELSWKVSRIWEKTA